MKMLNSSDEGLPDDSLKCIILDKDILIFKERISEGIN
jgi:hypothetical protein